MSDIGIAGQNNRANGSFFGIQLWRRKNAPPLIGKMILG